MKKLLFASLILVLLLAVSCSTTKATDVEPIVREVKVSDYASKTYSADEVFKILEKFAKDYYEGEEIVSDKEAKTVTIDELEFNSNVGPLAQDGYIVADIILTAQEDKAIICIQFVDAYTEVYLGPIAKKVSQGITEFGLKTLDYQANYVADSFSGVIGQYVYLVDNGYL